MSPAQVETMRVEIEQRAKKDLESVGVDTTNYRYELSSSERKRIPIKDRLNLDLGVSLDEDFILLDITEDPKRVNFADGFISDHYYFVKERAQEYFGKRADMIYFYHFENDNLIEITPESSPQPFYMDNFAELLTDTK